MLDIAESTAEASRTAYISENWKITVQRIG